MTNIEEWLPAAEVLLNAEWGVSVSCTVAKTLREQGRNRAYRLAVAGGPTASVILKACVSDNAGNPYVRDDPAPDRPFASLCNELAAARLIGPFRLGPKTYGGDLAHGFCLLEDLGDGETLADKLTGVDPAAATAALLAYARSLGAMHAATSGQKDRWNRLLEDLGGCAGLGGPLATPWPTTAERALPAIAQMGLQPPSAFGEDLARLGQALNHPGEYLAFTPSDCCPDNHFLSGEHVVFFDCEGATMRHALLDAAYFFAPFPTCWCCAALPEGMPERLLAAYRERFPGGADFDDQLTTMLAAWFIQGLVTLRSNNMGVMDADAAWGLSTLRQRSLTLVANLLARPNLEALLPGVAELARSLDQRWRAAWPDLAPMPLYPAFC